MERIGIIGSEGRMGQALAEAITAAGLALAGGVDQGGDVVALAELSDVLVDFSSPDALEANLDIAVEAATPILVGTTGLKDRHHFLIDHAADRIAVLQTGNTSLGINMLVHLVREAALRLDPDWDIEIVEMHHRRKIDTPSGTATMLGEASAEAREIRLHEASERGRDGVTGPRVRCDRLCQLARRHRGGRSQRDLCGRGRADRSVARCRKSLDIRAGCGARGAVADRPKAGPLYDGASAGALSSV